MSEGLERRHESWHLDKKVPITLIGAMLIQVMAFVWWASAYTASNDAMNNRQNDDIRDLKVSTSALNDMKADVAVIKSSVADIKDAIRKAH